MKTIDNNVLAGYNAGVERNRLRTDLGLIEFERTRELGQPLCLEQRTDF